MNTTVIDPEAQPYKMDEREPGGFLPPSSTITSTLTINVGMNELYGQTNLIRDSLKHVRREVNYLLEDPGKKSKYDKHARGQALRNIETLYVVGRFSILPGGEEEDLDREEKEVQDPWSEVVRGKDEVQSRHGECRLGACWDGNKERRTPDENEETIFPQSTDRDDAAPDYVKVKLGDPYQDPSLPAIQHMHVVTREEEHWNLAVSSIMAAIREMPYLKSLTWTTSLPFLPCLWEVLPKTLQSLCIEVSNPLRLDAEDFRKPIYISADEMTPLTEYTCLEELRILGMMESYQSIIWQTVWGNKSTCGGLRILELSMGYSPIVRNHKWRKADDVDGIRIRDTVMSDDYLGLDTTGVLAPDFGCGEYLDLSCIHNAQRQGPGSGLDPDKDVLPVSKLKLDGFVVDSLPFQKALANVSMLYCGSKCVDAGMVAPRSDKAVLNKYTVLSAEMCSMVVWPKWTGFFDAQGNPRDARGDVVWSEIALDGVEEMFSPVEEGWLQVNPAVVRLEVKIGEGLRNGE